MKIVIDTETNRLENPTDIWVIVCKDIATSEHHIFREVTSNEKEKQRFLDLARKVKHWIGHNFLGFDYPVLKALLGLEVDEIWKHSTDTLIVSKLIDYSRNGHSLEDYGIEFNFPKDTFSDFSKYSLELEKRCITDTDINEKVYFKHRGYIEDPRRVDSIVMEHHFQLLVNTLHDNGFCIDVNKCTELLKTVTIKLEELDKAILKEFPPKEVLIREFIPKATKFNTISLSSIPKALRDNIHNYTIGNVYRYTKLVPFNPSSTKQVVTVLSEAGWSPTDKTTTHIKLDREINRLLRLKSKGDLVDKELQACYDLKQSAVKYGWKINETNLATLPDSAPSSARTLAQRILYESRRRTLTEWLSLVTPDQRIHGKFYGIGAWTQRMAHQSPNTANIPSAYNIDGSVKLLGKEMRQLWQAPRNRLLVGVDAEGIQLRIFAHYIDDPEFTEALVKGKKDDKTDPHSLNQRILGSVCLTRQAAKRFIYALLLGAGIDKLAQILGCSKRDAEEALDRLLQRYTGFAALKRDVIPADAKRGWFTGLDGRKTSIPGDDVRYREHLCMSGYLQNGEIVVMKRAAIRWHQNLSDIMDRIKFVNMVHDEWQTEVPNDMAIALRVARTQAESLRIVGEELKLKCPLAGSYWNEDIKDYTIGTNWYSTH